MALKHLFSFFQHTAYFCQFWNRISQFPFFNLFRVHIKPRESIRCHPRKNIQKKDTAYHSAEDSVVL